MQLLEGPGEGLVVKKPLKQVRLSKKQDTATDVGKDTAKADAKGGDVVEDAGAPTEKASDAATGAGAATGASETNDGWTQCADLFGELQDIK